MKCPHHCSNKDFRWSDCVTEPGRQPQDGDCGMCYKCGGWWEMKDGQPVPYIPTPEELKLATTAAAASRRRFRQLYP